MARPNIPKFGDWKEEGNVPYTVYFEKAKASRGGKIINPNDPQSNPNMFPNIPTPAPARAPPSRPQQKEPTGRRVDKTRMSREDSEFRQYSNSPARKTGPGPGPGPGTGIRAGNGSIQPERGAVRPSMHRGGSEHSVDRTPAHQAKPSGGRGNIGSPVWEGKRPNERSIQGTPGRSRMNPGTTRSSEALARDVAIPKFGDWDKNPELAENMTYIFDKNSRNNTSGINSTPSNNTNVNRNSDDDAKFARRSCFQWWKK